MKGANLTGIAVSFVALGFLFLDKEKSIIALLLFLAALFYIVVSLIAFLSKKSKKK